MFSSDLKSNTEIHVEIRFDWPALFVFLVSAAEAHAPTPETTGMPSKWLLNIKIGQAPGHPAIATKAVVVITPSRTAEHTSSLSYAHV